MSMTRGISITVIGNFIPPVAALATQPILARSLGVDGRGEVAAATAPLLLAIIVLGLGVPETLTFFVARHAPRVRTLAWRSLVTLVVSGALGCLAVFALSVPLSGGDEQLAQLMLIATVALVPALVVTGLRGIAAGRRQWVLIATERVSSALLRLAAITILAATGRLDVVTATVTIAVTTFLGGFAYLHLLRPQHPRPPSAAARTDLPRFHLYAGQVWLGAAAGILYSRLDQLLLTPLSSSYELGIYAVAASVAEVILIVNLAIRDVVFAVESGDPDDARASRAARISTLITLVLGGSLAAVCPWAIPLFFGSDFSGAVSVTLILIAAAVLGNPGSVAGAILSGRGKPGLRSISLTIGLALNLAAVLVLVPSYGAKGAAFATLIASAFAGNNLNVLWLRIFYGIPMTNFLTIRREDIRLARSIVGNRFGQRAVDSPDAVDSQSDPLNDSSTSILKREQNP
jgi:O-antigen/teichoic acid export membrane protein